MKTIHARRGAIVFGIAVGIMLSGCGLINPSKPVAVITAPLSGTQVDANTEVQVQVNTTDDQGIVRIDLLVNGAVVATEVSPQATGQPSFNAVLRWTPKTSGNQVLEVRAYNRKGDASVPVSVNIQVRDVQSLMSGTPDTFPTLTPLASPSAGQTTTPGAPTDVPLAQQPIIVPPAQPPVIVIQPPPPQQPTQPAAPNKPSNFVATGTGTTIAFTWDDKSTNETGFRIYQVGQVAPVIALPANTGTGGMSYNWTGQPCNISASYYIRAYNDAGESSSSNSDGAVTIPCAETGFTATGSGNNISIVWNDQDPNESGFRIYQEGVANPLGTRGPDPGSGATLFQLTNLACNIDAKYFVRAYNSAGESPDSNHDSAVTVPCPPSGLHITSVVKTIVNYSFTDNATNEAGFHIYRNDALYKSFGAHNGTGTIPVEDIQTCGTTLIYSVRAFNSAGESGSSEHVPATTPPLAPFSCP